MKQVTIISDDRVGLLADISYILGKSGINIDGLSVDVIGGKAIIALEVRDPDRAKGVLENNGFTAANPEAIVIRVSNGSIGRITEMLQGEKIQVTGLSELSSDENDRVVALHVDKPRKATKMLGPFMLGNTGASPY